MQKENKGITLIALIITIIVMLILVGVTVTVSLKGGLFSTAKDAVNKTKQAVEEELNYETEMEMAMIDWSTIPTGGTWYVSDECFTWENGVVTGLNTTLDWCSKYGNMPAPNIYMNEIVGNSVNKVVFSENVKNIQNDADGFNQFCTLLLDNGIEMIFNASEVELQAGVFNGTTIESYVVPSNFKVLPAGFMGGCTNLKDLTIPSTVISIDNDAFQAAGVNSEHDLVIHVVEGSVALTWAENLKNDSDRNYGKTIVIDYITE